MTRPKSVPPVTNSEKVKRAWAVRRAGPEREIKFNARVVRGDGCHLWKGRTRASYGQFMRDRKIVSAHRVAWEMAHGPIPPGLLVLHHCDNPPCVKTDGDEQWPDGHLFLGTTRDNALDMVSKGRASMHNLGKVFPRGDQSWSRNHLDRIARGERHGGAKLTLAQVREIRARYVPVRGILTQFASEYAVSRYTIGLIVHGKIWREDSIELAGPDRDPR